MAETTSRRERILKALICRLERITRDDAFRTDLGRTILVGEFPRFGPDDPKQVIVILPQEDRIDAEFQEGKIPVSWLIDIAVLVEPDVTRPWAIVEAGIFDVKTAIEGPEDRTLGGLLKGGNNNPGGLLRGTTQTFKRAAGSEAVGASVSYIAPYWESWGRPEA